MTEHWRLLPYHRGRTGLHFALSDALVRHGTEATVWWHAASEPTLILGPGQRDLPMRLDASVPVTRRSAGGAAVYAATDVLGLDVFLPAGHRLSTPDILETYHWLGEVWCNALQTLGVDAGLISIQEARANRPSPPLQEVLSHACFGSFSPYEVACGGRKLVGLAQVRRRNGTLLQAAVHRRFDADALAKLLLPSDWKELARRLEERATGLDDVSPARLSDVEVFVSFASALNRLQACELAPAAWSTEEFRYAWSQLHARDNREDRVETR